MKTLAGIVAGLLVIAGAAWIYPPAGLIVAGLLILLDIAHGSRKRVENDDT